MGGWVGGWVEGGRRAQRLRCPADAWLPFGGQAYLWDGRRCDSEAQHKQQAHPSTAPASTPQQAWQHGADAA